MKPRRSKIRIQAVILALLLPLLTAVVSERFLVRWERKSAEVQRELSRLKTSQAEIQDQLEELRQTSKASPTSHTAQSTPSTRTSRSGDRGTSVQSWRTPPAILPAWEPESPYVWMEKSALKQLPLVALTSEGRIQPGFAEILGMNSAQIERIESTLQSILQRHFSNEVAHAKVQIKPSISTAAPGAAADAEGEPHPDIQSMEVVIPALGAQDSELVQEFEHSVDLELGSQRRQLLFASAQSWVDEEFSYRGENEKRYTVSRTPGGIFDVGSIRGPISLWHGVRQLESALPPHLLELFRPMLSTPKGH